ncbi:MAG: RNA polymerase sigma-54 factor, partial [Prevotella sp.]|nr:RNA polymerase sigma-54 factor [Prevotella sp.]
MGQGQIQVQTQEQQLKQTLNISQQQLLVTQLVELPVTQLVERVRTEMDDNPALESRELSVEGGEFLAEQSGKTEGSVASGDEGDATDDYALENEREERQSALDAALAGIGRDDEELPVYHGGISSQEEREQMTYGETETFYDSLKEQMGLLELSDTEADIMEYLIGSLDDDGLLRKSTDNLC